MSKEADPNSKILETGSIYFFYRPKIGKEDVKSTSQVQRFHIVLSPQGKKEYRLLTVGKKELPEIGKKEQYWGFVQKYGEKPEEVEDELDPGKYETKTRGERKIPAARPVGEGVYAIAIHENDHTHLAYLLEFPKEEKEVQKAFNIKKQGSYIINVKNPNTSSPPGVGLGADQKADFPENLQKKFENRRFYMINPPEFLNYQGAEIILIGAKEDIGKELGIKADLEKETNYEADIFKDLKLEKEQHPLEPLFKGKWE